MLSIQPSLWPVLALPADIRRHTPLIEFVHVSSVSDCKRRYMTLPGTFYFTRLAATDRFVQLPIPMHTSILLKNSAISCFRRLSMADPLKMTKLLV